VSTTLDPLAGVADFLDPPDGSMYVGYEEREQLRAFASDEHGEALMVDAVLYGTLEQQIRAVIATPVALAELLYIDGPGGPEPFKLWRCQVEGLRVCLKHRKVSILKARQLGITWTVCSLLGLWDAISYTSGYDLIVSNTKDDADDVIDRARTLYNSGPGWLHTTFPLVVDNTDELSIRHGATYSGMISLSSSANAGRGRTFRRVMADERARWKRSIGPSAARQRMTSLRPTVADSGSLVELSTADGYDGHFDTWSAAVEPGEDVSKGNGFVRLFFGALEHPNRDLAWVMAERSVLDADEEGTGAQEYPLTPEEAFLASGRCAFSRDALVFMERHSAVTAPWRGRFDRDDLGIFSIEDPQGDWWVWEWPTSDRDYMVVADTSSGHGDDFSALAVIDLLSWDQVAALHGKLEPGELAREMDRASRLWLAHTGQPALLVPEGNNHGEAVTALLREWSHPRLYSTEELDSEGKRTGVKYGWQTNEKSRKLSIAALQRGLRQATLGIRDRAALVEMHRFVWCIINDATGSGRYQADEGAHDDRVMCWAIAAAVLEFSDIVVPAPKQGARIEYVPRISSVTGY
jgi:hypothetical protein